MVCSSSCLLSTAFIIGMIYFYNATEKSQVVKTYKSTLSPTLREKYEKIVEERKQISYRGYILGFLISLIIILYKTYKSPRTNSNRFSFICIVVSTSFITNYLYYILSPKSDTMLHYLKSKEEIEKWQHVYREMQYNYHFGIALGLVAVGIMAFAFRC